MFDYTKEDTYNHLTNNIKQTECDAVAAKNFQMNEMNKIKTDQR